MKKLGIILFLLPIIVAGLIVVYVRVQHHNQTASRQPHRQYDCSRIISMSPSVTEIVDALGLSDHIIATDRYSSVPKKVQSLPKVGGFLDPDIEKIVSLKPSIVILPGSAGKAVSALDKLSIPFFTVNHATLDGVQHSFVTIASRCGVQKKGKELLHSFSAALHKKQDISKQYSVLMVISRDISEGKMTNVIAVGNDKLLNDIITASGGVNALSSQSRPYVMIQQETLIATKPDILVDISQTKKDKKAVAQMWRASGITGRVVVIDEQWAVVPGPRLTKLADTLRALYNELEQHR